MWFLGVLERLLRPLMRTLSLQNDTSQGDGGPPLSSHSASSVVDASNVASNTMIPPSPTCNQTKERKKKENQLSKFMERAMLRGDFRRPSFQRIFSSRFLFHEIFSPPRRNIHFPLEIGWKKLFETPAGRKRPKWISARAFARESRPRGLRLRCNLHANQTCSKDLPQVFSRNKRLPLGISVHGTCIWRPVENLELL